MTITPNEAKGLLPEIRVKGSSNVHKVASAIAGQFRGGAGDSTKVIAIGAAAVNQAVKAVATARGMTAPRGQDLIVIPAFDTREIDGGEVSRIILHVRTA